MSEAAIPISSLIASHQKTSTRMIKIQKELFDRHIYPHIIPRQEYPTRIDETRTYVFFEFSKFEEHVYSYKYLSRRFNYMMCEFYGKFENIRTWSKIIYTIWYNSAIFLQYVINHVSEERRRMICGDYLTQKYVDIIKNVILECDKKDIIILLFATVGDQFLDLETYRYREAELRYRSNTETPTDLIHLFHLSNRLNESDYESVCKFINDGDWKNAFRNDYISLCQIIEEN